MRRPIAIDLFSGCGGMSLGLEAAGFNIVAAVELDLIHALVHHFNFPYSVSICKDIRELTSQELLKAIEAKGYGTEIDLIAGGPPCQGFSCIGKRQLDDPRNSLVFEYFRIIKEIKPKYFLFENVPGIASGKHQKLFQQLIQEFTKIGYTITEPTAILDACFYGAPQKRKRLIICGSRLNVKQVKYPEQSHSNGLKPLSTCGEAIDDLRIHQAYIGEDIGIDANVLDYSGFRKSYSLNPSGEFSLCHTRQVSNQVYGHLGSRHLEKTIQRFKTTLPGNIEKTSRFFKLAYDGQCNTLRAGTGSDKGAYTAPRPIHYSEPRCITIREAARLHTFPDWFRFHDTIWHGFREIGNAVIPFLAKSLGEQIIKAMNLQANNFETDTFIYQDEDILKFNMKQATKYWDTNKNNW